MLRYPVSDTLEQYCVSVEVEAFFSWKIHYEIRLRQTFRLSTFFVWPLKWNGFLTFPFAPFLFCPSFEESKREVKVKKEENRLNINKVLAKKAVTPTFVFSLFSTPNIRFRFLRSLLHLSL